jgi:hypothetical protein
MGLSAEEIAASLGGKRSGKGWSCRCPAHEDKNASFSIDDGNNGSPVFHCHAGCTQEQVMDALCQKGLWHEQSDEPVREFFRAKPKIVATYDYTDASGVLLYQAVRYEPKDFKQRRPDGNGGWEWKLANVERVLYRLPDLIAYPDATAFIVEGEKDADRLATLGLCATTIAGGAKSRWDRINIDALAGRDCLIIEDNDKPGQEYALNAASRLCDTAKTIRIVRLPNLPPKGDVSDWLDADPARSSDDLVTTCFSTPLWEAEPAPAPFSLDEVHATFRKWFGDEYDMDAIDAVLATAAAERLSGDPLWLLVISGPGATKTETVQTLMGCGAHVTSTIQSEGALLSASSRRERSKTATGGLLRKIGDRGILVIKDVTSILSADRNVRASVLAAVREIYDGR